MNMNILVRTSEYRGDHAADVAVAMSAKPDETVAELIARARLNANDWLELRVIDVGREDAPPAPTPDPWAAPSDGAPF